MAKQKKKSEAVEGVIAGAAAAGATFIYQEGYVHASDPSRISIASLVPISAAAIGWYLLRKKHRAIGYGLVLGALGGNLAAGSRATVRVLAAERGAQDAGGNIGGSVGSTPSAAAGTPA